MYILHIIQISYSVSHLNKPIIARIIKVFEQGPAHRYVRDDSF